MVTRLGLYGGSRSLYGDFSTKEAGEIIVAVAGRHGGITFDDPIKRRLSEIEIVKMLTVFLDKIS